MRVHRRRTAVLAVLALIAATAWAGPYLARPVQAASAHITHADSEAAAQQAATAQDSPVIVDSDTTETNQVLAEPDGTLQLTASSVPVRVLQNNGWTPIDTSLQTDGGQLAPAAAAVPVRFSDGGSGPLVQVQAATGQWLSESWPAGPLPAPTVDRSTATYADVLPGVDLRVTATDLGMSQVLEIENATAATNPALSSVAFGVSSQAGLSVGSTTATGPDATAGGSTELVAGQASWWDSSLAGAGPAGPAPSDPDGQTVPSTLGAGQISVDAAAAVGQTVQYPLYVDPDWTGSRTAWTYVDSAYPTTSYWNGAGTDNSAHVGYVPSDWSDDGKSHLTRSMWTFNTSVLAGTGIGSAQFSTTDEYASSCSAEPIDLYRSTGIDSNTTWNTRPGEDYLLDSQSFAHGYPYGSCAATARVGWDAKQAAVDAANQSLSSVTLMLKAHDESNDLAWRKFGGGTELTVTYNHRPNTPSQPQLAQCYAACGGGSALAVTNTTAPTFSVRATDPDGQNVSYNFTATPTSGGTTVKASVPATKSGTTVNCTLHLAAGITYDVTAVADDGTSYWNLSYASQAQRVQVDTNAPPPPKATATGTTFEVGKAFTLTLTAQPAGTGGTVTAGDQIVQVIYSWSSPGPTLSTPATCGTETGGMWVYCPSSASTSLNTQLAPISRDTNNLYAEVFAVSGNHSNASTPVLSINAAASTAIPTGHSWPVQNTDTETQTKTISDTATTAQAMQVGGATIGTTTLTPNRPPAGSLSYSGGQSSSVSPPAVLDTTKSFTVAAWLTPTAGGSGTYQTALSQDGGSGPNSGFYLQLTGGHFGICLSSSVAAGSFAGTCAIDYQLTAVTDGSTSYFVAGVYDPVNHQLRLYINGTDPVAYGQPGATTASTGPLRIGLGTAGTAQYWSGAVTAPAVLQGVADPIELNDLSLRQAPSAGGSQ